MINQFIFLALMSIVVVSSNFNDSVTIKKDSGISIRETSNPNSKVIGAVYNLYSYKVTDSKRSYIKVKTNNGVTGWAWVGENDERFTYLSDKVVSNVTYNIPVNGDSAKGLIQPNETVELIDVWSSRIKVQTPDNKHGWIYTGKYNDPWVDFLDNTNKNTKFVDFEYESIKSNGVVSSKYAQFSTTYKAYSLISADQSSISFSFELNNTKNIVLFLHHMATKSKGANTSISIVVNGVKYIENLRPIYGDFKTDVFHIGHLLKDGQNEMVIFLEESNTPYYIQSIKVI